MKKITFLSIFLMLLAWGGQAQCIRTGMFPTSPVPSDNLGLPQQVTDGVFSNEYSEITGLIEGIDYVFTCTLGTQSKYITVTDLENVVLVHGNSPLTWEGATATQVRLHYSDNAECDALFSPHVVTIKALLECSPPIGLAASGFTATGATLSWQPTGEETAWQVLVLPESADPPTAATSGTDVTGGDPTYTDNTLDAASPYKFYVRASCGAEFSAWNGPLAFNSGCEPVTSFSENFDGDAPYAYDTMPICWYRVKNGADSADLSIVSLIDSNYNTPYRCLQLYSDSNEGDEENVLLIAPKVSNLSAGTHRLKFFARSGSGSVNVQFGTVDNNTAAAVFTELENIDLTDAYQEYAVDYTGYAGTDTFIAIRHNGAQSSFAYFDDIRWEAAPACADVSDIAVPAGDITANQALVIWEANGGETQWDIVYGAETVTDPTTLVPVSPAPSGAPQALLASLAENTSYKVWVRSLCGDGAGAWIGPKEFRTACIPVSALQENFDALSSGSIPECWSVVKNGTGASQFSYCEVRNWNSNSPSNSMEIFNSDSGPEANIILATPKLTNIGAGTHRIKFYARSGNDNGSIQVGTVDSTTEDASFTEVMTIPLTSTYAQYAVEFTNTDLTDPYIAFRHNSDGQFTSIFIDDVIWEPIPACPDVSAIVVLETTASDATLNWEPGSGETEWDVVYGATTVTDPNTLVPMTPAPSLNPEATITGLTDNMNYKVWVRSVCGTNDGLWIGPITFKTKCLPTNTLNENFDTTPYMGVPDCWSVAKNGEGLNANASAYVIDDNFYSPSRVATLSNSQSAATANIMLISPAVSNLSEGTHRVKFYAKSNGATGSVQIGTVDNATEDAFFTEVQSVDLTSAYAEYTVNFPESGDGHIAFRHNTGTFNTIIYIDDVRWELSPLCADVAGVAIPEITTGSALVTWQAQGSETGWQVAYGTADVTDPATLAPSQVLTAQQYEIAGLDDNAAYKVWVRSVCGDPNGNGTWIGPYSFNTKCLSASVPYVQDFETAIIPNLPNCTLAETFGSGNTWNTNTPNDYGFDSKVLRYNYNYENAADTWFYTQGVNLTGGTEYAISYRYGSNSDEYHEKMKVMYGANPTADDMTEEIADHNTFSNNVAVTNQVTFTPGTTGVYYFGFHAYSDAFQYNIYVDDITIDVALGNGSIKADSFSFYPNPVKDVLHLSHDKDISDVAVFNLVGQQVMVKTVNANSVQIDMSDLAAGSYLVKVTSDNQIKTIKVIKQ